MKGRSQRIEHALSSYVSAVGRLGIVSEVIVAVEEGKPAGIYSVVSEDLSVENADDPTYDLLEELGGALEDAMEPDIPLLVATVNPSQLHLFLAKCRRNHVEVERISVE